MRLLTMMPDLVNYSKLSILGLNEAYVVGLIILCCLIAIYLIIEPITQWLIITGSTKTISYFLTTLIVLVLLLGVLLVNEVQQYVALHLLKIAFGSFSVFGILLITGHYIKLLIFQRSKKTN